MNVARQMVVLLWNKAQEARFLCAAPARYRRSRRLQVASGKGETLIARLPEIGSRMAVDANTYFARAFVRGSYETHVVDYLKRTLRPGMTCVDVGANVGYFTLLMARQVGRQGRVIAFEPSRRTCQSLRDNIVLNGLTNVTAETIALSDHEGAVEFHEGPPGYDVYNSMGTITHPSASGQAFTTVSVPCTMLDRYLEHQNNRKVDIIKLDVEGAELFALRGMATTLERNPQVRLIIELADQTTAGFGYAAKEIVSWLLDRGWQISLIKAFGKTSLITSDQRWTGQMVVAGNPAKVVGSTLG